MKTNSEIRRDARARMSGNWGSGVLFAFVSVLMYCIVASPQVIFGEQSVAGNLIYIVAYIMVGLPLSVGIWSAFLCFVRGERLKVEGMFRVFSSRYYGSSIVLGLLVGIYTFLWSLLLVIPGIIKSLSYALAPYILVDNPEYSGEKAICKSMEMMRGHKMDLFLILLGFVGLEILSAFLLFIPMLWLSPYYNTVLARFYEEVKVEHTPIATIE